MKVDILLYFTLFLHLFQLLIRCTAFEKADVERRRQKADSMQFMTEPDEDHARFPNLGKEGDGKSNESKLVAEESDSDDDDDRDDSEFKEGTGYNNAPIQKVWFF